MTFRFNFAKPQNSNSDIQNENVENCKILPLIDSKRISESSKVECNFLTMNLQHSINQYATIKIGSYEVGYVSIASLDEKYKNNGDILLAEKYNSDIIPGKYEGGFKIWECSIDLAKFLTTENYIKSGNSVLELGCGAGLPGIVAYLSGANVCFQDFNSEVLELVTFPNVILNTPKEKRSDISKACQFLYGDWSIIQNKYYSNKTKGKLYDIILTSETIYERKSHKKLLELMKSTLKPDGKIYLAAKIHYFGVGGGINDFEALVAQDNSFQISTILKIPDAIERIIMMMTFKT